MKNKGGSGQSLKESLSEKYLKPSQSSSSVLVSNSKTANWILGVIKTANSKTDLSKKQVLALVEEAYRGDNDE